MGALPLGLELLEDLPLRVVAENTHIDEAIDVELLGSKVGHYESSQLKQDGLK